MKIIGIAFLSVLLASACGGASDKNTERETNSNGDGADDDSDEGGDESGESDDDGSESDDDSDGDDAPATNDDDVAGDDDGTTGDDTPAATPDDDVPPAPPPSMTPSLPPVPVMPPVGTMIPPVELPEEGCVVTSQSTSQGYCNLNQACSTGYQSSWCSQNADATWTCQCNDGAQDKQFLVTTADAPCEMVAELCPSVVVPDLTDREETCTPAYTSVGTDNCRKQVNCSRGEAINDQVSIVQTSYSTSYCSLYNGGLSCSCSSPTAAASFSLADTDVSAACDVGLAFCREGAVEPVGERTCTVSDRSSGDTYCSTQQSCSETVSADGTEVTLNTGESSSCQTDVTGKTTCYCYSGLTSYTFSVDGAIEATTCDSALGVCERGVELEPYGEATCKVSTQSASTASCSANSVCERAATAGDLTVGMQGSMYTYCQQNGDTWQCQCQTGAEVATVDVDAEDAWSACTDAIAKCPELVEVQFTSGPCGITIAFDQAAPMGSSGGAAPPVGTSAPATPTAPPGMGPCFR